MSEEAQDVFGLVGRALLDKYLVDRVVAKGGFGTVYQGRHLELQTPVAVKVLMVPDRFQGDLREEFLEKFRLEARTIAALNHPAIVRVLDFGTALFAAGASPWMALEWLEGHTLESELEARLGQRGRSPREALALLRPAFDALACAHEVGIAHRDVKPANMMVVRARRGEPGLRMLDFGIAKVMEPEEQAGSGHTSTQTELTAFSLLYAAPEQISRSRTGPWTDVHALGLILTEILTDTQAYQAQDTTQIYAEIVGRERPTPGRAGVDVGPWEAVLARALSLRPAERHGNAADFLAALEAAVDDADRAWQAARSPSLAPHVAHGAPAPAAPKPDTLMGATGARPAPRRSRYLLPLSALGALALFGAGLYAVARTTAATAPEAHLAQPPARPAPPAVAPQAPATQVRAPQPPAPQPPAPQAPAAAPDAGTPAVAAAAPDDGRPRRHRRHAPAEGGRAPGGGIVIE
ncbi:MAG: serine/threonine-protein kinase [Polyangiales bacterium]